MQADSNLEPPEGLTNKEKRKWRQEQKRLLAANPSNSDPSTSTSTPTTTQDSPSSNSKRKRSQDDKESESTDPSPAQLAEAQVQGNQVEQPPTQTEEEEVEALSHKEKRKRRKLEKTQAKFFGNDPSSLDPETVKRPTSSYPVSTSTSIPPPGMSGANKPTRSPFSLWIANLSFQTSPQRIQEYLEEKGIKGISRVHMPKGERRGQYSKG